MDMVGSRILHIQSVVADRTRYVVYFEVSCIISAHPPSKAQMKIEIFVREKGS